MNNSNFICAVPIWEKDKQTEMNHSLLFKIEVSKKTEPVSLKITAHSRYQIFINGSFFAAGPARAAHGFFRVDNYSIENLSLEKNIITIIAAGYNSNSFYITDQPSFICAELTKNDEVLFATNKNTVAYQYKYRTQKVQRYSFQRPFGEVYNFNSDYDQIFTTDSIGENPVEMEVCDKKVFIERNSPYCEYRYIKAKSIIALGNLSPVKEQKRFKDRSFTNISERLKGFPENELECCSVNEAYMYDTELIPDSSSEANEISIKSNQCAIYDMGLITTGYIRMKVKVCKGTELYIVINELLPENGVPDPGRDNCANVLKWTLEGNREYDLISFEPYDYKYIQLMTIGSDIEILEVGQYRETYPESLLINLKDMPNEDLQKVYNAAKESFVQNATDIFMDCPGRERAGWLCDSFFTSRVEKELTGKSLVEHDFLENFILPNTFKNIPSGMLPMCYPADHYDGGYIHNWALWYVLELEEYLNRTGDRVLIDRAKDKVFALEKLTASYENKDGLLEKIGGWIFVEWSKSNDYVRDINYPSNMLYTLFLETVDRLYNRPELKEKAEKLRKTIIEKSFDGEFFCDNAVLDEQGIAVRTNNRTETCQYYAFFSKVATKETFPELFETMMNDFGPSRNDDNNKYPDVPFANAFIGNYLRLELLFKHGMYDQVVSEIKDFFLPMAEQTGTLWENMKSNCSCNHGFASHIIYWLNKII